MNLRMIFTLAVAFLIGSCATAPSPTADMEGTVPAKTQKLDYPPAPTADASDNYFGTEVADPYRPLEDAASPETIRWTEAENRLTRSLLDRPDREQIKKRLTELFDYPRISLPTKKKQRYFFSRNEGLQNQPIYFVQEGLSGTPRVLIDPNSLSADGTVAVTNFSVSDDASLLGYAISRSGSDRQEIYVRDIESGRQHDDKIEWVKFTGISWTPDNAGFFYNRYAEPGTVPAGDEHYFPKLYYHRLGTAQSADQVVYERPADREVTFGADVSDDGRYLFLAATVGTNDESEVFVDDLQNPGYRFAPVFTAFRHMYNPDEIVDGTMYVRTDDGAARGRVIGIDVRNLPAGGNGVGPDRIREIIPESADKLEWISLVNRKIVAHYLHNAASILKIFDLDGRLLRSIDLPGVGEVSSLTGTLKDSEMFFSFQSFTQPPTNYRYDFTTDQVTEFQRTTAKFDPRDFETTQVWYPSKDGTKVSMFLSSRKGLKRSPETPVFLYGYGGFNIPMTPFFNPVHFYFMERGGIFAVANLRGGSEYGEEWHRGGMLEKKQNVFDDFAAAAEWLVANGYTSRSRLSISGRSNGGLLAGASLVQRPELYAAVVVQQPVIDMLRYHLFTLARFWIGEYGSAENREQFKFLYAYSPLHNIREEVSYPATLVTTSDTDDRVDPGQAKKFAARLQEAQGGDEPILIRIDTKSGHSSGSIGVGGKPVSKLIDEWADIWTFVFWQIGMS
jgi:prolyl oligopeptidase